MFDRIKTVIAAHVERRRVFQDLMALDDRMLADIGINRAEIGQVASGDIVRPRVEDMFGLGAVKAPANRNARNHAAA